MQILKAPSRVWTGDYDCTRCDTRFRANEDDLKLEGFKTSGLHFAGTAVIEDKFFVECPTDRRVIFVDDEVVPVVLRDELRKKLKASS